ncbi:MAG: hypothetical protein J1E31_04450 [Helicobacter sp.]|nr:hypothetical protein [Helicobacter sp.]
MALSISNNLQNLAANKNLGIQNAQNSNSTTSKQEFESLEDYTKYLGEKYGVNSGQRMISGAPTSINVSAAFIKEAFENADKRQFLEENLEAIHNADLSGIKGKVISQTWNINEKGEISAITHAVSSSGNDESPLEKLFRELKEQAEKFEKERQKSLEKQDFLVDFEAKIQEAKNQGLLQENSLIFNANNVKSLLEKMNFNQLDFKA